MIFTSLTKCIWAYHLTFPHFILQTSAHPTHHFTLLPITSINFTSIIHHRHVPASTTSSTTTTTSWRSSTSASSSSGWSTSKSSWHCLALYVYIVVVVLSLTVSLRGAAGYHYLIDLIDGFCLMIDFDWWVVRFGGSAVLRRLTIFSLLICSCSLQP